MHKSFLNQTTLDLRREKSTFLVNWHLNSKYFVCATYKVGLRRRPKNEKCDNAKCSLKSEKNISVKTALTRPASAVASSSDINFGTVHKMETKPF